MRLMCDSKTPLTKRQSGFTLVELISVIVIVGILALGTSEFISNSAQSYSDVRSRDQLSHSGRITVEKISREIRNALPNSVRIFNGGACIEFIPVVTGSNYTSLPVAPDAASNTVVAVEFPANYAIPPVGNFYVAAYPIETGIDNNPALADDIYTVNPGVDDNTIIADGNTMANGVGDTVNITLDNAHLFPARSPTDRLYIVNQPVSFCVDGNGNLFRYQNYGFFSIANNALANLPVAMPNRTLLANELDGAATPFFTVQPGTTHRSALVQMSLSFATTVGADTESINVVHEVQLRNVP